jgi:hypothetical protein
MLGDAAYDSASLREELGERLFPLAAVWNDWLGSMVAQLTSVFISYAGASKVRSTIEGFQTHRSSLR